jgi:hypothetical protein
MKPRLPDALNATGGARHLTHAAAASGSASISHPQEARQIP